MRRSLLKETQPANKIYAFDRGWRIMRYVTSNLFKRANTTTRWWWNKAGDVLFYGGRRNWFIHYFIFILVGGYFLAGVTQYISAIVVAVLFLSLYIILIFIWAAISLVLISILFVCTFTFSRFYRIFFRCPDCHKDMPIPIFICPACAIEHSRLWPSIYGVVSHRCICDTKLATTGLNIPGYTMIERDELERICPHCRRPLNPGIGKGTNLHIPIVGGTFFGKTNFIVMATREFKRIYEEEYGYSITFTDERHERDFEANLQLLDTGRELKKTEGIVPQAYNLRIQAPKARVPKLAYIYDAAGEALHSSENIGRQEFFKFIDGIIFVIDPFAVSEYRHLHEREIESIRHLLRPGTLDVMQAYERMIPMFEASVGLRKRRRFPHPIAIVVTKVDALSLEQEIGAGAIEPLITEDTTVDEDEAMHILVRNFLCNYGLDHFVRDVESQFKQVRYFSCSALGRLPTEDDSSGFVPIRVVNPLIWVLEQTKAIKMVRT